MFPYVLAVIGIVAVLGLMWYLHKKAKHDPFIGTGGGGVNEDRHPDKQ